MTKSSSFAKHHMRENRNNQFRPEQQNMVTDLRKEFPGMTVVMEERINYFKENGTIGAAYPDILIEELGVIFRLNGEIHYTSDKQIDHDWEQKMYLENLGYFVIDVDTRV